MSPVTVSRAKDLSIGELSRRTGVNVETIRYYERVKILPTPQRTEGGHRLYGPNETRALAFIRRARVGVRPRRNSRFAGFGRAGESVLRRGAHDRRAPS